MILPPPPEPDLGLCAHAGNLGTWRYAMERFQLSTRAKDLLLAPKPVLGLGQFLDTIDSASRPTLEGQLRDQLNDGQLDMDFARRDGRFLRICGQRLPDMEGLFGILLDIGSRRTERQLASRLAAIIASSADAIIGMNQEGAVTEWNPAAELIFGYSAQDMIGRPISILSAPGREDPEKQALCPAAIGGSGRPVETARRRKDGQTIDVEISVAESVDSSGRIIGTSMTARDITAQKRALSLLRESEARLRSVLDSVPDAVVMIDADGIVQSFSATAEALFGYRADEIIGQNVKLLMPEPDRSRHDGYLKHYLTTGERRVLGTGRITTGQRRDGAVFPLELHVSEVRLDEKIFFTGFIRDLTERQQNRKRLRELQEELIHMGRFSELGEMASALAHELNQPLTGAASYLNGARRLLDGGRPEDLATVRGAVENAAQQTLRAGEIIRRMRNFVARRESDRQTEDLRQLAQEAFSLASVGTREVGVRLRMEIDERARFVLADRIQVQQVLVNLIRNGIEAMQTSKRRDLTISAFPAPANMVEIDVCDTGSGIAPDIFAQLFQPFVTSKQQGLGVGLSISRTIVEAHGGQLWAEARSGGGAVFHMTLRRADVQGAEGPAAE